MAIRLRMLILAAAIAFSLAPAAQAQGYSRAAQRVISQSLAATGGRGWLLLRGWHETGRRGEVPYEAWIDPVRYGLRVLCGAYDLPGQTRRPFLVMGDDKPSASAAWEPGSFPQGDPLYPQLMDNLRLCQTLGAAVTASQWGDSSAPKPRAPQV